MDPYKSCCEAVFSSFTVEDHVVLLSLFPQVTRDAAKFLRHILRDYYEHILKNPDTLITRFYGYHAIRVKKESGNVGAKLYFVIMRNFFHTPVEIHRRYNR